MFAAWAFAVAIADVRSPEPPGCGAAVVLFRRVRASTGGDRWDAAKELIADGTVHSDGLRGRTHIAVDLVSGATSTEDDQGVVKSPMVTSPSATWEVDLTGGMHALNAPNFRAAARTWAYLARRGYFRPAADPASFECLSDVSEDGRTLHRVRIVPRNGLPVALWLDPESHLVVRTQQQAPTYLSTVHYGAYRETDGLKLPHEVVKTNGRPEATVVYSIRSYHVRPTVIAADIRRPPEPTNHRIVTGAASTQVALHSTTGPPSSRRSSTANRHVACDLSQYTRFR
jgi:hypothetical protein